MARKKPSKFIRIKKPKKIPTFIPDCALGGNPDYFVYTDQTGKPYWFDTNMGTASAVTFI